MALAVAVPPLRGEEDEEEEEEPRSEPSLGSWEAEDMATTFVSNPLSRAAREASVGR